MKKKVFAAIGIIAVVAVVAVGFMMLRSPETYPLPEQKILLSESGGYTTLSGSMKNNIELCDVAIKGKIISSEPYEMLMLSGHEELDKLMIKDGSMPKMTYTKYTVQVENTLIGDLKEKDTIQYFEVGLLNAGVTKPKGKETVVLFLNERDFGYVSVNMEHSIFTVSSKGQVYSYSNTQELSQFDGKNVEALLQGIAETAQKCNVKTNIQVK